MNSVLNNRYACNKQPFQVQYTQLIQYYQILALRLEFEKMKPALEGAWDIHNETTSIST